MGMTTPPHTSLYRRPRSQDPWDLRQWPTEHLLASGIAVLGFLEILARGQLTFVLPCVLIAVLALALWLVKRLPGVSLALVWLAALMQVMLLISPLVTQFIAVALLAFGTARYGSTTVLWLSGLSIPAVIISGVLATGIYVRFLGSTDTADFLVPELALPSLVFLLLLLIVPWLLGLTLRVKEQSAERELAAKQAQLWAETQQQHAESERSLAQQVADLQAEQTRLARDVHDVVGHSLAVILAQAESAQFLNDDDSAGMRAVLGNVATSARGSLQDVRNVLSRTGEPGRAPTTPTTLTPEFERLIDGVRAAGHRVSVTTIGTPQPLPPELATVAVRVLQEMLTNAIKHGDRDQPCLLEQHWEGELRLEVRNHCAALAETQPITSRPEGLGVPGMRSRLESIGGRLDIRRRQAPSGTTYTATAWIPLRPTTADPGRAQ